jgi:hypothetical protein
VLRVASSSNVRDLLRWVDRFSNQSEALKKRLEQAILAMYVGVDFYSATEVSAAAQQAAATSNTAALQQAGLAAAYVATVSGLISGENLSAPTLALPALRNGADMTDVFSRPAKLFRRLRSEGKTPDAAFRQSMQLASTISQMNMTLAQRGAYQATFARLESRVGITGYRRIVHPELAKTGSCGLCIVASDQVYHSSFLLPIHGNCNCTVLPIIGEIDPGNSLNNLTLGDFYGAAAAFNSSPGLKASTLDSDLKRVKVAVHEHGEYGPVLTFAGQHFTGPDDLAAAA